MTWSDQPVVPRSDQGDNFHTRPVHEIQVVEATGERGPYKVKLIQLTTLAAAANLVIVVGLPLGCCGIRPCSSIPSRRVGAAPAE